MPGALLRAKCRESDGGVIRHIHKPILFWWKSFLVDLDQAWILESRAGESTKTEGVDQVLWSQFGHPPKFTSTFEGNFLFSAFFVFVLHNT